MANLLPQRIAVTLTHGDVWSCPGSGREHGNFKHPFAIATPAPRPSTTIAPPAAEVKRLREGGALLRHPSQQPSHRQEKASPALACGSGSSRADPDDRLRIRWT